MELPKPLTRKYFTNIEEAQVATDHDHESMSKSFWKATAFPLLRNASRVLSFSTAERKLAPSKTDWKPVTLRAPVLGCFILVSTLFIVVLELLAAGAGVTSDILGTGPIVIDGDGTGLSTWSMFLYLYLPTVLSVCYSMAWNWVELDIKRLEPWFQLSKPGGALAEDSLLLHYPFDFVATVPVTAWRRKHWNIFFGGTVTLIVFWCITPLQSAIFATGTIQRERTVDMRTTAAVIPFDKQYYGLNNSFLTESYSISWLGSSLPSYTTREYATLPFEPASETALEPALGGTFTGSTTVYSTDLSCTPATVTWDPSNMLFAFDSGKGCVVPRIELPDAKDMNASYLLAYIPYYGSDKSQNTMYQMQNPNCSSEFEHNFLAIWGDATTENQNFFYGNITALFCETSYFVDQAQITVDATNRSISGQPLGMISTTSRQLLPHDVLNITNFEFVAGNGFSWDDTGFNYPETQAIEQYPRVQNYSVSYPAFNILPYALAGYPYSVDTLYDGSRFHELLLNAHRLLFAVAMNSLMTDAPSPAELNLSVGSIQDQPSAITFSRIFSVIVECGLTFTIFGVATLWYYSHSRPSKLTEDPSTMAKMMCILTPHHYLCNEVKDSGTLTDSELEERLRGRRFRIQRGSPDGSEVELKEVAPTYRTVARSISLNDDRAILSVGKGFRPIRPKALSLPLGACFTAVLLAAILVITVIFSISRKDNGITRPSNNPIVLGVLENLIPTIFATFLEPFWVVINRLLCLLQPLEELRRGNARPSVSVDSKYASRPPQLNVWDAVRSRHFLLASVCWVAMLTNVLAVALSGLFNDAPALIDIPSNSTFQVASSFNGEGIVTYFPYGVKQPAYDDHYYGALTNLTYAAPLPPWIDFHTYYQAFDLTTPAAALPTEATVKSFRAKTRGYGISPNCAPVSPSGEVQGNPNSTINFGLAGGIYDSSTYFFNHTIQQGNITTICNVELSTYLFTPGESVALEIAARGQGPGACLAMFYAGWIRMGAVLDTASTSSGFSSTSEGKFEYGLVVCTPELTTDMYELTVDTAGRVLDSTKLDAPGMDMGKLFSDSLGPYQLLIQANLYMAWPTSAFTWHNDTRTYDWLNSVLEVYLGSNQLVDPNEPILDLTTIASALDEIFQRCYAMMLAFNPHIFDSAPDDTISMTIEVSNIKIFMSDTMTIISLIILGLQLLVAAAVYIWRPRRFLPRMPTGIGSLFAFVSSSRCLEDFRGSSQAHKGDAARRYAYGHFNDVDGKAHVGIEKEPFVVPLTTSSPSGHDKWTRMLKNRDHLAWV